MLEPELGFVAMPEDQQVHAHRIPGVPLEGAEESQRPAFVVSKLECHAQGLERIVSQLEAIEWPSRRKLDRRADRTRLRRGASAGYRRTTVRWHNDLGAMAAGALSVRSQRTMASIEQLAGPGQQGAVDC
jgi:hypothetical protein